MVFAQLAGAAVEGPRLGNLDGNKFDYDIHRLYTVEIVGKMCADTERRYALALCVMLYFYSLVDVEPVAEYDLFACRVDIEAAVLVDDKVEFFVIVAAVDPETLEHVGIVLREIEAEYAPAVGVVEECAQGATVSAGPCAHGEIICHLGAEHARNSADKFVSHSAYRHQVVLHGEVYVARADKSARAGKCLLALLHRPDGGVLSLERRSAARAEVAKGASGLD